MFKNEKTQIQVFVSSAFYCTEHSESKALIRLKDESPFDLMLDATLVEGEVSTVVTHKSDDGSGYSLEMFFVDFYAGDVEKVKVSQSISGENSEVAVFECSNIEYHMDCSNDM